MPFASTTPFPTPFYEVGEPGLSDVPTRWKVAIDSEGYFIDPVLYERRTLPMLRSASDQSNEPGEQSRTNEGYWTRSGSDWHKGAGQLYFDRPASDRARFRASKGIDPWTEGQVSLLHATEVADAATDTNLKLFVAGTWIYKIEGATVAYSLTGAAAGWTSCTFSGMGAAVKTITYDGVYVYIGDGANVWRIAAGTTAFGSAWSTFDATGLWYVNGRLVAASNNVLVELASDGTTAATLKTSVAGYVWKSVVGSGTAIFATQTSGTLSETYFITVDATDGSLNSPAIAMAWVLGETINCLGFYGNLIFIGTSKGFRIGTISANTIDYGALTEIAGGVNAFTFEGRFAWFTWNAYDAVSSGLGRIDIGTVVNSELLQFAYATDLMVTSQAAVLDVVRFASRTYLAVSALGFYRQATTYVTSGVVYQGWVTHNDVEPKVAIGATVRHQPLDGEIAFGLAYVDGTVETAGTSVTAGSLIPEGRFSTGRHLAERTEPVLTLTAGTTSPILNLWKLLSAPTGPRVDEVIWPIMVSPSVEGEAYNPLAVFLSLKRLEALQVPVVCQEGSYTFNALVDRVAILSTQGHPLDWTEVDDLTFFDGVYSVRLLTVEV